MRGLGCGLLLIALCCNPCSAQQLADLPAECKSVKTYPSLIPVQLVEVRLAASETGNKWLQDPTWNPLDRTIYKLTDTTTKAVIPIQSIQIGRASCRERV